LNAVLAIERHKDFGHPHGEPTYVAEVEPRAAGVTKSAIYRAIKSGRLPACKLNGGSYAIYPAARPRTSKKNRSRTLPRIFS
jgi:hypothetical protein